MRFDLFRHIRFTARPRVGNVAISRDADELIKLWGEGAYERATYLSWEEDTGIISSSRPGHWWQVRREVGRRLGEQVEPPAEIDAQIAG